MLQIPEEHDEGHEMRSYTLEDLKDLQNKLMLMSGKGEQGQNEVDRFAEVRLHFCVVTNIYNTWPKVCGPSPNSCPAQT